MCRCRLLCTHDTDMLLKELKIMIVGRNPLVGGELVGIRIRIRNEKRTDPHLYCTFHNNKIRNFVTQMKRTK